MIERKGKKGEGNDWMERKGKVRKQDEEQGKEEEKVDTKKLKGKS